MTSTILQLLLVLTPDCNSVEGQLYCYERASGDAEWEIRKTVPIEVGMKGMTWNKKEGDRKSPAGLYPLMTVFGHASDPSFLKMPYLKIEPDLECVDDPTSKFYNQFVNASHLSEKDWESSEKMYEIGDLYKWGIVVGHNHNPIVPGEGSCIFLHILKERGAGTYGCTAMEEKDLVDILHWLDPLKKPHLLQLYRR